MDDPVQRLRRSPATTVNRLAAIALACLVAGSAAAQIREFTARDRAEQTLFGLDLVLGMVTAQIHACERTDPPSASSARQTLADFAAKYPAMAKYLEQSPGSTRTRRALKAWDREDPDWPLKSPRIPSTLRCDQLAPALAQWLPHAVREVGDFDVSTLKPWPYVPPRHLDPPVGRERSAIDADIEECRQAGKDATPLPLGALAGMNGESTHGFLGPHNSVQRGASGAPTANATTLPEDHPLRAQMPNADAFAACLLRRGYTLRVDEFVLGV